MKKSEFAKLWNLTERNQRLWNQAGKAVAVICQYCNRVQPSAATISIHKSDQPEYCECLGLKR